MIFPSKWTADLRPLKTDWVKPYLTRVNPPPPEISETMTPDHSKFSLERDHSCWDIQQLVWLFMACLPSRLVRFLTPTDMLGCQVEPDNISISFQHVQWQTGTLTIIDFCIWIRFGKSLLTTHQAPYIILLFKQTYGLLPNGKKKVTFWYWHVFVLKHLQCKMWSANGPPIENNDPAWLWLFALMIHLLQKVWQ